MGARLQAPRRFAVVLAILVLIMVACTSQATQSKEAIPSTIPEPSTSLAPTPTSTPGGPAANSWRLIPAAPISSRVGHSAVWDGAELLIWGGLDSSVFDEDQPSGAAYQPDTDDWRVLPEAPMPRRSQHVATFTGREMLIWGGLNVRGEPVGDGAAYDPASDSWRTIPTAPLAGGASYVAAWSGDEWFIVDAGDESDPDDPTGEAAAYDPQTDSWRKLAAAPVEGGWAAMAVWTGDALVIIRLKNHGRPSGGVQYDPVADAWTAIPPNHDLGIWTFPFATWTGEEILVTRDAARTSAGLIDEPAAWRYEPAEMVWLPASDPPEDLPYGVPGVGGGAVTYYAPGGGQGWAYVVSEDHWSPLPTINDRSREGWSTTWAGDALLVWGGSGGHGGEAPGDGVVLEMSE
jgi:hypothetical protein